MKDKLVDGNYFPEIDSIRAIAVLCVLFHHYFNQKVANYAALGNLGVDIFFTLSGFLITGILISYRSIRPVTTAIKKFYFRRALRIFPIYYLYILIIILLFGKGISQTVILWASLYGLNFYITQHGFLNTDLFSHFWSLAVEEQFYLVWPLIILICPLKHLKKLMVFAILSSIAFTYYNASGQFVFMHPISCMQALAIGALTKYFTVFHPESLAPAGRKVNILLPACMILWVCSVVSVDLGIKYASPLFRVFASLGTAVVLMHVVLKLRVTRFDRLLNSKALQFVGRISYGIYVYHVLVKVLLTPVIQKVVNHITGEHNLLRYNLYLVAAPLLTGITIFIAWLSFRYIESPIIKLKNRVTFQQQMPDPVPAPAR